MQLKTQFKLTDGEFRSLSPNEDFKGIEEQIYQTFCHLENGESRPVWLWEYFKQEEFSAYDLPERPECYLSKLIDEHETIWLGATTTYHENTKIWWYEGKILPIIQVLAESCFFEEFYFVSKKFRWLFCINHHDVLTATGQEMPEKLANLVKKL